MQAIDPVFLIDTLANMRQARNASAETEPEWAYWWFSNSQSAMKSILDSSFYRPVFRDPTRHAADEVYKAFDMYNRAAADEQKSPAIMKFVTDAMLAAYNKFETIFLADLQSASLYFVPPRGGYDTKKMVDFGWELFPSDLSLKVPAAILDVKQATRCIGFDLPTAAAFHLHRAHETILRSYWSAVSGGLPHPKLPTMGNYISQLEKLGVGDATVVANLRNIKDMHRNPVIHPDQSLESLDEAFDLLGVVRTSVGYMLRAIPISAPPALTAG